MSDFTSAMGSLFTFLFTQFTACANFFITSVFGQVILGLVLFTTIVGLIIKLIYSYIKH